ncbi:L,D-transpeptidase [Candidatus Phyllobacterium onerii]|jgi:lipoprotein-anchoring transpeptidase ErfK/SrfK|uniref:L,D-transpeptidase n=1 Tax=Candidatus Phyllobacterium onerii TaxID=3020828 RepID=UPI00232DFCBC|nr:L,D-transpeptidase [Phyllobacterium sp. IY22]
MLSRRSLLIGMSLLALSGPASAEPIIKKILNPFGLGGNDKADADAQAAAQPIEVAEVRKPVQSAKAKNKYGIDPKYMPQDVEFTGYKPGTIVIDPKAKFLYLVESSYTARRYGIAVGKEGLEFKGTAVVQTKREWPRWIPTKEMIEREPAHYAKYENGMDGGPGNPLGARALYLSQGNKDTHIRIHGTIVPSSIGSSASNGCFRMVNDHVIDLYNRVSIGTEVIVL